MVQVSLTSSTTFDGDLNALVEDQGTSLTVRFDLDEPAPAGGLKVYIDSETEQILNRLDLPGAIANPRVENLNLLATQTNFDNSGLAVEITEGSTFATVTLDIFDNIEPDTFLPETFDGLVETTLSLVTADQIDPADQSSITGVGDYTIDANAASSVVLFADAADQLPGNPVPPTNDYDEAVSGDISNDPNSPLVLTLAEGTTRLIGSAGGGDQDYVTVTVPDGFELSSLNLEAYSPNDVAFIGVQEGSVFTEPLDNSADTSEFLGYTLFGTSGVGTDILDNIGNGSNGADFGGQGFEGPLPAGTYTFALQQLGPDSDYTLAFNMTEATVVENTAPVATDDSYTVITAPGIEDPNFEVPTELTVDAAEGVLANDSDVDGDDLTVAIDTDPTNGSVALNGNGSFTYTPTDGFTTGEQDSFTYTVSDGNGGSDTGSVVIEAVAAPSPPPTGDPVVSFEVVPDTFSEEDPNNLVEWRWSVAGDFPEGGITVNMTTMGGGAPFAFTEQFAASPQSEFIDADIVGFDEETGDLNILLEAPEASFKLYFVDDILEEGAQEFEFFVVDGDGYTVDADTNGGIFTITDDNGGPGVGPTVGLSVSETDLTEGDTFTVTFNVEGDIPAEGVQVLVQSDVPGSLGQFDLADLGNITTTGIAGLPEVGDGGGGSFFVTITEPTATITLDVFDDILAEEDLPITFSLANGELYEVSPDAASTTVTISDEVQPAGPTVGITVDNANLIEGGDPVTLTISVDGDIPEGGLPILINDLTSAGNQSRSLSEFDIANVTTTGLAEFPTPADGDSGFFVTVTEPTATITLAAADEGADEDEAAESFTFEVIDGEAYEVDANADSVTLNISDPVDVPTLPQVSVEAIPATISEEGSAEDRLFTLAFTVEGEIPEGGLLVLLENLFGITDQSDGEDDRGAFDGLTLSPPFDRENNIIGFRLLENESSLQLPIANDLIEETTTFDFRLIEGDGYTINPDQGSSLFTINDDNGGPGVGPTIGLSVSEANLAEGDPLIVNFTVNGDIPAGGVDVLVQSPVRGVLGQFDLANLDALQLSGVSNLRPGDTFGQSFIATVTEPNASITLDIFNDIVAEEPIELPFTLANGELYEVDPAAESVTLTISDDVQLVGPTVGISLDKSNVVEGEAITLSFNVEGDIPAEGITVLVNDNDGVRTLTEFDVGNVQLSDGIAGFPTPADGDSGFFVTLTQATASITLPVLDDGADEDEATESFTFEVVDGEAYEVDANAGSVTLNIADADTSADLSVSLDLLSGTFGDDGALVTPNLVESGSGTPILSLLISADGPVPEEGLVVEINTDLPDITQFIEGSNFLPTAFGGQVVGAIYSEEGLATGIKVRLDNRNTVVNFTTGLTNPFDTTDQSPVDVNFSLVPGEGYAAPAVTNTARLYRDISQVPVVENPPTVGVSFVSDTGTLTEGGDTGTLNFTVEGEIPEDGLVVFVSNNQFAGIVDFDLLNATTTGGAFPAPDGSAGGFFFKISDPNASITFQARVDEEVEGLEQVSVALQPLAGYTIDPAASDVNILVQESDDSLIQVSFETSPEVLVEADGTVSVHTFSLSAPPPAEGVTVTVQTPGLADFDASAVALTGITRLEVLESSPEQLRFTITEQTATIELPVADDGMAEGLEEAVFTLLEGDGYQVAEGASEGTFTLVDTAADIPAEPISEDTRTSRDSIGDTIATAQATGLSAENSNVSIEAAINGNFFNGDRTQTDNTEDVDMYSVDLFAGDVLSLDIDARINRERDDAPDTILRLFDADGNQLAQSDDDFAPDELFAPGRQDSYLEFTAETDGTYYVGVSSFGNGEFSFDNAAYDPNVAGSGTGRSDGEYTLNLGLNEASVAAATEIPPSTGEGPTVSLAATTATYDSSDNLIASALVQFTPERRNASILTLSFDVEGEIPEEGVETYITTDVDLSTIFSTRSPFGSEGVEVLGAVYDDAGAPVGLKVKLMTNTGFINLNLDDPEEAPTDGEETITVTLEPAAGYTVGEGTFSSVIYDTLDDVPEMPTVPTVSISVSETALVESEGNTTTLTFELNEAPPEGGVTINVDSGVRAALGEFDVFNAEVVGGGFPSPNFQASGFFFTMTEQTATITLAAFDETTNPEIPAEDALEGIDEFTFTVQPGAGYAVAPNSNAVTVTIADNPDSLPIEVGGEEGENDGSGLTESEFNDTIADAMLTGFGPTNPLFEVEAEIGTTRQTRNFVDATEDVDMYAFDIEAGQTVIFDVDGGGTGNAGVEGSLLDSILRVFDADGNEVAINENGGAPDEVFQANGDSYLEFAPTESGTYYVGISTLGNNFYDPNVQGSGSGWIFEDRFEPGPYRFTATLKGAVVEESGDTLSTNNDRIADALTLDLSTDNPHLKVQGDISQRYLDRSNTADATEDVDMYAVQLSAGDRITIDADSVTTDLDGFQVGPAPDITIFDADGNKVVVGTDEDGEDIFAFSSRDGAPDEAFVANRDAYLDFTAETDGTYYIGISQYRNNNYDANVVGSGSGAFFDPRFGVSAGGEYTLDIALNPTGFDGPIFEEFTGTPDEGAPVVTFTTDAGTFVRAENRDDIVISSELIEDGDVGRGVLNVAFTVEGEIPEDGLEVLVVNEDGVDLNDYFQQLGGQPRIVVGGTLSGGLYDANGALIGFKALLTDNNALFPFTAATDRVDDPDASETLTFSLANSADYAASPTAGSSEVTFFDSLEQVQAVGDPVPTVGFTLDQTEFIESEGTVGTITVTVDGEIPAGGLQVYLDSPDRLLGEFDVFNAEVTGGAFPSPNGTASGFFFRVFENTATIKLAVFDETTNDQIPAEDALEGIESFNLALQPLEGYAIDANAASVDFTIKDTPDSVVITPDDGSGDGGDGGEMDGPVTDNDGRDTIDDTIETSVATGLSADQTEVTIEGSIAIRWRNPDEQKADNTEDVDMYSFDLAAGESVTIDAMSVPFEFDGMTQVTAPTLRVFNAAGEEVAIAASEIGAAPVADPSLSFTAAEADTHYVGVSQYLNDNYDPMVNASGDGVQLPEEGISPGEYTLKLTLDTDQPAVPVVSVSTPTPVVSEDGDTTLTVTFSVDGDIPEGGLPITVGGDLTRLFDPELELLVQAPFVVEPETGLIPVANRDPEFDIALTASEVSVSFEVFDDIIEEEPLELNFALLEGEGYAVDGDGISTVTVVDGDSVIPGSGPTVSLSVNQTELTEGDEFTVSFNVDGAIPEGGLELFIDAGPTALGEFDIFGENGIDPVTDLVGLAGFPVQGGDLGGFFVTLVENQASITLSVFDDGANEGPETLTFELTNGEAYEVAPDASTVTLSINDFETVGTDEGETLVGSDDDNSIAGKGGSDIIAGGLANDIILGGDGDDVLRGDLNSRNPQDGSAGGNDIIFGGEGNDRIGGKAGNDILSGDAGDDIIWGDDGDDIIMGVTGNDTLVGDNGSNGSGSDLFVFGNGDGTDTIVDFEVGIDRIGLVDGELTFAELTLTQDGSNTLLGVASSGETLAILNGVQASSLSESSFEVVPDVSNPEEALALI